MTPKVYNIHKDEIPADAVYIGRAWRGRPESPFHNPYILRREKDRDKICDRHKEWLLGQPELIERIKQELKGKNLICFCAPRRCHGDLLLAIANGGDIEAEPAGQVGLPGI